MAYVVIQQHKFGRMYLCGWSKRWGAIVCANRFVAIKYPTEDEAELVRPITPRPAARTSPTAGRSIGRFSSSRETACRVAMGTPDHKFWGRSHAGQHLGNLLHSSGLPQ